MSTLTNSQLKNTKLYGTPINGKQPTAYDLVKSYQTNQKDDIPTQTSQSGKALTTDGTNLSWGAITGTGNFVKSASPTLTGAVTLVTVTISTGAGTPEGVVTAPIGSLFLRTDGSTSTTLYVKTSGTGNTGWTAK